MPLTDEQQQIITDSGWIVNSVLKKLNRRGNIDLQQEGYFYLCKCLLRFDPTLNVKWETYAYKSVLLYLKRKIAEENHYQRNLSTDEDELENITDDLDLDAEATASANIVRLRERLTDLEKQVLDLRLQDNTVQQIADKLGLTRSTTRNIWYRIREKTSR